jgi:hypothetical protein
LFHGLILRWPAWFNIHGIEGMQTIRPRIFQSLDPEPIAHFFGPLTER